jgi:endonuclease/exonuclease/phosphatase family metal-dependent hydrolase
MTFNLANYDNHGDWPARLKEFANIIEKHQPDISSFQEVRFNPNNETTKKSYQNMGEEILYELNQRGVYKGSTILSQPVMFYCEGGNYSYPIKSPISGSKPISEWEGLSIVSKATPIITGTRFLSIVNNDDPNRRSVKYITLTTSSGETLYIFNCHFSYDLKSFNKNMEETVEYMKPFMQYPCMLMGDMNQTDEKDAFDLLRDSGFYDVWKKLRPGEDGFTDQTAPQRIDYIWANFDGIKSIDLVGTVPEDNIYASDHYGLIAEVTSLSLL